MEGPWKRRSILRDLDRGIVVSVDSSSSTANSSTTTVNASLSLFLFFWCSVEDFGDRVSWKINFYGLWRSNVTTVRGRVRLIIRGVYVFFWELTNFWSHVLSEETFFWRCSKTAGIFICELYEISLCPRPSSKWDSLADKSGQGKRNQRNRVFLI